MQTLNNGAGLGLRRDLISELEHSDLSAIDFFEIAPENWLTHGGRSARQLHRFTERFPFVCHGLSLSIGAVDPLDIKLLQQTKGFMQQHGISRYTEHLSWCSQQGQLYDLLPIPCTAEAVDWVAARICQVQDILGMRIGVENASYYLDPPQAEMDEASFIAAICEAADCGLHLDVNNVYVNSVNFAFDAHQYLRRLPLERVCYMHVAGHYQEADGSLLDTHGAPVIDPVWRLLDDAYQLMGFSVPTCLERDSHFPPLTELLSEVARIKTIQQGHPMTPQEWVYASAS